CAAIASAAGGTPSSGENSPYSSHTSGRASLRSIVGIVSESFHPSGSRGRSTPATYSRMVARSECDTETSGRADDLAHRLVERPRREHVLIHADFAGSRHAARVPEILCLPELRQHVAFLGHVGIRHDGRVGG